MKEILHQLKKVVYPIVYKVSYIPNMVQDFFHPQYVYVFLISFSDNHFGRRSLLKGSAHF